MILAALSLAWLLGAPTQAQRHGEIGEAVERILGDLDANAVEIAVDGADVTLAGPVDSFWVKHEAIRRTLAIAGVRTVATELTIPTAEGDRALADDVAQVLQRYEHHTLWDHLTAVVEDGIVTLGGRVTPERDKATEIFERVAKLPGVQDVQSTITPLPPSLTDATLRRRIAGRLFAHPLFVRFGTMSLPPFRIVVEAGIVVLVGYVDSGVERAAMELVVADVEGVRRVDNRLQPLR